MVGDLGGMGVMMREMVEGQRDLVEEIRNLGELAEGIFWGQNPIWDSEEYNEWLKDWSEEEMKESKELELEQEEYIEAVWEQGEGVSREPSGAVVGGLGGMAVMMREMVEGQRSLVEEIRNLGELAEVENEGEQEN